MKSFLAYCLLLIGGAYSAYALSVAIPGPGTGRTLVAVVTSPVGFNSSNTAASPVTFSSQFLGDPSAGGQCLVVGLAQRNTGAGTVTGVSASPVALTQIVSANDSSGGNTNFSELWAGNVSATTADVIVTSTGVLSRTGIIIYRVKNTTSCTTVYLTRSDTIDNPISVSLNVPAGGNGIGHCHATIGGGSSFTWAGLTEDVDNVFVTNGTQSAAHSDFASEQTGLTSSCTFGVAPTAIAGTFGVWSP